MAGNAYIWVQYFRAEYNTAPPPAAISASIFLQSITVYSTPTPHPNHPQFGSYFSQGIAVAIQVLVAFLQLKYLGSDDPNSSPFATHPTSMRVAVCSSVLYYLAYIALLRLPLPRFFHHFLVPSGCVSVASLAAVLLPDSFGPFVYSVFAVLSASELLHYLYRRVVEDRRFLNGVLLWWAAAVRSYGGQRQMLPL